MCAAQSKSRLSDTHQSVYVGWVCVDDLKWAVGEALGATDEHWRDRGAHILARTSLN
jgi:hypothetical protein